MAIQRYLDSIRYSPLSSIITDAASYKILIVSTSYTFNRFNQTWLSDITGEVTGTNYTAGGKAILPTYVRSTANDNWAVTWPEVTWPSSAITGAGAIIYRNTGTPSTSPLLAYNNFDGSVFTSITSGEPFRIQAVIQTLF